MALTESNVKTEDFYTVEEYCNSKFQRYRIFNPTLTDYVPVSQNKPLVEHFIRQPDESWKLFI